MLGILLSQIVTHNGSFCACVGSATYLDAVPAQGHERGTEMPDILYNNNKTFNPKKCLIYFNLIFLLGIYLGSFCKAFQEREREREGGENQC
jgi:hypothetical protein